MTCKTCGGPVPKDREKYCSDICKRNWNQWSYLDKKIKNKNK